MATSRRHDLPGVQEFMERQRNASPVQPSLKRRARDQGRASAQDAGRHRHGDDWPVASYADDAPEKCNEERKEYAEAKSENDDEMPATAASASAGPAAGDPAPEETATPPDWRAAMQQALIAERAWRISEQAAIRAAAEAVAARRVAAETQQRWVMAVLETRLLQGGEDGDFDLPARLLLQAWSNAEQQ